MRVLRVFLAAIAGLLWSVSAQAYGYTWIPETAAGFSGFSPVGLFSLGQVGFESESAGSHFSFIGSCSYPTPCAPAYSTGDFGSFSIQSWGGKKPIVFVDVSVTFNADGTLTGTVDYNDEGADYYLSGSGNDWSGQFNSDLLNCYDPNPCQATGYWTNGGSVPVPEPSTWMLLFAGGVAGAGVLFRRRSLAQNMTAATGS